MDEPAGIRKKLKPFFPQFFPKSAKFPHLQPYNKGMDAFDFFDEEELIPVERDPAGAVAQDVFGVPSLYPWQRLVIANIMECEERYRSLACSQPHQQTEDEAAPESPPEDDVLNKGKQVVLLPTGAGKSMCFMVPSQLLSGRTLIIYPLLALMSDQLRRIQQAGLDAVLFRGQQTPEERAENFQRLDAGAKIILANPEVLQSEKLLEQLATYNIVHAAIDEAHCVSEWGDTFRPSYLSLGTVLEKLKIPIITAFTATASPPVLQRVAEILFAGQPPYLMKSTSDRQNIHYSVVYTGIKEKMALRLATQEQRPMIIFCGTRAKSESTARLFREIFPADEVKFYHAGLTKEEKTATEQWFFPHKSAILCCTCAFGMGIDKSDIRTVIHLEVSPTAEAYIQEAGRGGRDGSPTKAILLWSPEDAEKSLAHEKGSRGRVLGDFALGNCCRRQVLLNALGGEKASCSGCDFCDAQESGHKLDTRAYDIEETVKFIKKNRNRFTVEQAAHELKVQANKKNPVAIYEPQDYISLIHQLKKQGTVTLKGVKTKRLSLSRKKKLIPPRQRLPRQGRELLQSPSSSLPLEPFSDTAPRNLQSSGRESPQR